MEFPAFSFEAAIRALPDYSCCNSAIEHIFYVDIQKHIAPGAVVSRQFECSTQIGKFYLDFSVEIAGRRVAFECDGKDYHEAIRDSKRDRAIVDAGLVNRIYRLRGYDICFHLHDALDLIRVRDPSIFSARGHDNIEALATRPAEHRDESCRPKSGFPFAALRWYKEQQEAGDYCGTEEQENLKRPTVVCWTDGETEQVRCRPVVIKSAPPG